jgi:hypothetical protein
MNDYSDPSDLLVKVVPLQACVANDCDRTVQNGYLVKAEPRALADSDFVLVKQAVPARLVDSYCFYRFFDFHCPDLFFDCCYADYRDPILDNVANGCSPFWSESRLESMETN